MYYLVILNDIGVAQNTTSGELEINRAIEPLEWHLRRGLLSQYSTIYVFKKEGSPPEDALKEWSWWSSHGTPVLVWCRNTLSWKTIHPGD